MKQKATNIIICPNSSDLPYESIPGQSIPALNKKLRKLRKKMIKSKRKRKKMIKSKRKKKKRTKIIKWKNAYKKMKKRRRKSKTLQN